VAARDGILLPVSARSRRRLSPWILLLLLAAPGAAQEAPPEATPPLPTSAGTLEIDGQATALPYAQGPSGPLFALQPLADRLGGKLSTDPLGQSSELALGATTVVLGPNSPAATIGKEIIALTQPTAAGAGGVLVPLDFLQRTFGDLAGFDFVWQAPAARLVVTRRAVRELPLQIDVVHVQGVTTVVLQFSEAPRYHVVEAAGGVDVLFDGDRIRPPAGRPALDGTLVKQVTAAPDRVRVELQPGAAAQSYVLRDPFRLVLDVYKQAAAEAPQPAAATPQRHPSGVQTIVIDPGHGGAETGAITADGTQEKDLTLLLAQALKSRLESRLAVRVVLTRNDDSELSLDARSALANQFKADLFISIHLNSAHGAEAHGAETYFLALQASDARAALAAQQENARPGTGDEDGDALYDLQLILWDLAQSSHLAASQRFAGLVQGELNTTLGLRDRGVKQAPFRVLMGAAMPAVLVELGFLSNPDEEKKLQTPLYRAELVEALVRAVESYKAQADGAPPAATEAAPR